jgi:hypothetical protein
MSDGKVCEHCLLGILVYSLYGQKRVYECELGIKYMHKDLLAGFTDTCDGYYCGNGKRGEAWVPKYERISYSQMRKSEECLSDERREKEYNSEKANKLRKQAEELLMQARDLEK